MKISENYASFHDAEYGIGSWLRPGAPKPMKYIQYQNNANPGGSSANRNGNGNGNGNGNSGSSSGRNGNYNNNGRNGNNNNNNNNNGNNQNGNGQKEEESAEETDDPGIWWKSQTSSTKLKVLRAMAAEKVFKMYNKTDLSCPTCSNKGVIGASVAGGNESIQRCPTCRGSGLLYKIIYH